MGTPINGPTLAERIERFPSEAYKYEDSVNETTDHVDQREEWERTLAQVADALRAAASDEAPIPMRLPCPSCGAMHIDEGEFATKPHHTHACQECGMVWRPAVVHTVGVRFLPGYRNQETPDDR